MDQNIQKALWLGVGILFFVAVVTTGLFMLNKGRAVADASGEELDRMTQNLANAHFNGFDNEEVTGGDLLNFIKNYKGESGEMLVVVTTSYPDTHQYISTGTVSNNTLTGSLSEKTRSAIDDEIREANQVGNPEYINRSDDFYTQLIYDANGAIIGITAAQQ